MKRITVLAGFLAVLLLCFGIMADIYEEQFINTTYRDDAGTTGEWGTQVDGKATPGLGPRVVQSVTAGGSTKAVATNGKYVFCASSNITGAGGGLYVFDGETYDLKGSFVTNQDEVGIAVAGGYAYLVRSSGTITVVDIGNLSAMSTSRTITGLSNGGKAAFSHNFLYVAAGTDGFYAIDLKTETVSQIDTYTGSPDARKVKVWGRFLLVADDAGLFVFSLNTPGTPTSAGNVAIADCRDVDTDGYFAFAASDDFLRLVNLSNPTAPSITSSISSPGEAQAIAFAGGFTVACYGDEGVRVYDYRDYSTYKYSGQIQFSGSATAEDAVAIGKQTAVATGDDGGVAFISNAHKFAPSGDWGTEIALSGYGSGEAVDIIINGQYAYATVQTYGVITIDLASMTILGTDEVPGPSALGMALAGDRLLVAGGVSGLYIYNISTPGNPSLSSTETFGDGIVYHVVTDGKFGYVALGGDTKGVARFDIFNPSSYVLLETTYDVFSISLGGNWLGVTARDEGFGLIDIADFAEDAELMYYTHSTGRCWGTLIENDYAYIAYELGGLRIVDISNPPASFASSYGLDGATVGRILGLGRFDSLLVLIRDETEPLVFVDVTDPTSPTVASTSLLPAGTTLPGAMTRWQDNLVIADFFGGMKTWEVYTEKNLLNASTFTSTPINGATTGIKYFWWESEEYFPPCDGDCPKDTLSFWVKFSDGSTDDSVKIFRLGMEGTNTYNHPPLMFGGIQTWEYIGYLPDPVDELTWIAIAQEGHETWTLDSAWYANYVKIAFSDSEPPAARRRVSVRMEVDFGGEIVELEIGLDSTASDRFDPAFDELCFPVGPGPHAYFEIDDPDMPIGTGLSNCWVSTRSIARPLRLVLSEPAVVSWTIPEDLEPGVLVLNGIDMASASTIALSTGEHLTVPGAVAAVNYRSRLERGWNLLSPFAYPLTESPENVFGVPADNVWAFNEALGGYYNPTQIEEGKGYFVLTTSQIDRSYPGVYTHWTRVYLNPGWNLIGGPSAGRVHITELVTQPDGLIWPGPFYTFSDGDYEMTEWLEPGSGYWVYSIGEGVLFAENASGSMKTIPLAQPDFTVELRLSSGNETTHLTLGIDSRANDFIFDRLLVPPAPGKNNLGGLMTSGAPTYLSTSVKTAGGEWELFVWKNCRISSSAELRLERDDEEFIVSTENIEIPAGRYKIFIEGTPRPKDFYLGVMPNPFNSVARVTAYVPRAGDINIAVYDIAGRKVATIANGETGAGRQTYVWDAVDSEGKDLPSGIYFAKLALDGTSVISRKLVLLK